MKPDKSSSIDAARSLNLHMEDGVLPLQEKL